jgi:GNAT superfamily N-acetyltransferase
MSPNRTAPVVGFATWTQARGTIEPEDLFVDPGWRRRGTAPVTVSRIVDVFRARDVRHLEATVNPHAQGFYSAAGFIDCVVAETDFGGRVPQKAGDPLTAISRFTVTGK